MVTPTSPRPGPRRVLVTGSRTWVSPRVIRDALQKVWGDGSAVLVTGASPRGADRIAEMFWRRWGGQVERHPADWQLHGRRAGFNRNAEMVAAGADVCLAFIRDGSPGASNTVHLAEHAGIPVYLHTQDSKGRDTTPEPTRRAAGQQHGNTTEPDADTDEKAGPDDAPARARPTAAEPTAPGEASEPGGSTAPAAQPDLAPEHPAGQAGDVQPAAANSAANSAAVLAVSAEQLVRWCSYPQIAQLVARAKPGSRAGQLGREALGLLMDNPDLYERGDQTEAIARALTGEQITQQRRIVDHGPLYELMGRAAELRHSWDSATTPAATAAASAPAPSAATHDAPTQAGPVDTSTSSSSPAVGRARRAVARLTRSRADDAQDTDDTSTGADVPDFSDADAGADLPDLGGEADDSGWSI